MGSTLTSISTMLVGKGFKNVANFNGQEIIQCITPTGGWMINPLAGQTDAQALPDDQVNQHSRHWISVAIFLIIKQKEVRSS